MKIIKILLGAVCLSISAAGGAAPKASGPTEAAPALPDGALRLSELLNPTTKMVELGMKGFDAGVDAELEKKPEDKAVYDANPGLLQAVLDAGRPVMRKHLLADIPTHQRKFAQFYADNFSTEELDQLIAFYSSPTGAKVVEAMYSGMDFEKVVDAMDKSSGTVTAKDVAAFNASAASQLPYKFDADDWKAIFAFQATPVHAKLLRVVPEFSQLVADLENESDPTLDSDMNTAIEVAVKAYFEHRKASAHP